MYLHSKGKARFSSAVQSQQKLTPGSSENCSPYIRLVHECSEAYTKMHDLWLSLCRGSSDDVGISCEEGTYVVHGCKRGEREVAGTDRLAVGARHLGKEIGIFATGRVNEE